jgi:type IV secretory pathway VirB2 component (pilin)
MPPFLRRLAPIAAILVAILAATLTAAPAQAHETGMPHLIHEYEGWVALAVAVTSLLAAGLLIMRALRR